MTDDIESPLAPVEAKATRVDFDGGRLSSDGGLILLNDADHQIGLMRDLAAVRRDPRDPRRVHLEEVLIMINALLWHHPQHLPAPP